MKHTIAVLGAVFLAAASAFAFSAVRPTDSEAAATGGYVKACGGGSLYLNAPERRTLQLHSEARASRGLRPLCVDPTLTGAARAHAREMMDRDYMSHNSANGETYSARLRRFGYTRPAGENISWGSGSQGSPESRFEFWMNSPPHRANILARGWGEVGIGTATGRFKGYGNAVTYTVDFGTRR
jgi:uncharacterized protein YkwD